MAALYLNAAGLYVNRWNLSEISTLCVRRVTGRCLFHRMRLHHTPRPSSATLAVLFPAARVRPVRIHGLLGVSLIVLAGLAAPKAHAQTFPLASHAEQLEAWQIVAEMQILHLTAFTPAPEQASLQAEPESQPDTQDSAPAPFQVAAAQTASPGSSVTATLTTETAKASPAAPTAIGVPDNIQVAPIVRPPMPRIRPAAAPPPPIVNSREDICNTLATSAHKHGLPVAFFGNLIYQESGLKPRVVSHVGARGIAQFMPGTARMVGLRNPFNPREALPASAKFLRSLLHQFGNNYGLAAAAYNAGPGKVSRWLKRRTVLPKETRDYVMTITGQHAEKWRGMRGNRFGHRLTQRIPCAGMPAFAHINDPVMLERDMVRKALMMLSRPGTQPLAVPVSMLASAHATPASTPTQKPEDSASAPVTTAVVASASDTTLPRMATGEQPTGTVAAAPKAAPPTNTEPTPAKRTAKLAPVAEKPSSKPETKKAELKRPKAKNSAAKKAKATKAQAKKAAAKKEVKIAARVNSAPAKVASRTAPKEKNPWAEYYASRKKQ
jgi:soluble lytic murein transglycosylase-like protein